MIVLPEMALNELVMRIVEATHELCDELMEPQTVGTLSHDQLKMAAVTAVQIATGKFVWPGTDIMRIKRRSRVRHGIFEEEG